MKMTKDKREKIKNKFNGKCAYTGKDLGDDWQIDHVIPKCLTLQGYHCINEHNSIENLVPALRIVNHYKRSLDLERFRYYMSYFHQRLAKLPKKTRLEKTKKRIEYMNNIANAFDINVDEPFGGKFYFETLEN